MQTINEMVGYDALVKGAAFIHGESGYIALAGNDRVDFLQRQTTNDVRLLSEGRAVLTVLTSPTARIIDTLWLVADEDKIGIMTAPARGASTMAFLRGKIFFMDKVTVEDQSADVALYDLDGPLLGEMLGKLGIQVPAIDEVRGVTIADVSGRLIGRQGVSGVGARLIVAASGSAKIEEALIGAGLVSASQEAYETARVEAGQAGINEMTEEFTPLEVRLNLAVSDSKGCYTGQEIIARQITYDKVTRSLVGLRLSAPVDVGQGVMIDGRNVGVITSVANSPRFGAIALAVIKRPHHEAGTVVELDKVTGSIVDLPFME